MISSCFMPDWVHSGSFIQRRVKWFLRWTARRPEILLPSSSPNNMPGVVELVDTHALEVCGGRRKCRFDSCPEHHFKAATPVSFGRSREKLASRGASFPDEFRLAMEWGVPVPSSFPVIPEKNPMPSPTPFSGQTAIITGGASGLGLAIARRLRAEGAYVALFDRDEKLFAGLDAELAGGGKCFRVDVTDETSVTQAVGEVLRLREKIHILVNSAGITGKTNVQTHDVDLADFEAVFRINVRAVPSSMSEARPAGHEEGRLRPDPPLSSIHRRQGGQCGHARLFRLQGRRYRHDQGPGQQGTPGPASRSTPSPPRSSRPRWSRPCPRRR